MSEHGHLLIRSRAVADNPSVVTVAVSGPMLLRSAGELRRVLTNALDAGARRLQLDLSGVTDADPAGLATLVVAARRLQARADGGSLSIIDVSPTCVQTMRRLHLFADLLAQVRKPERGSPVDIWR